MKLPSPLNSRIALSLLAAGLLASSLPLREARGQRTWQRFWEERFAEMEEPELIDSDRPPLDPADQRYLYPGDDGLRDPSAPFFTGRAPDTEETPRALLHYAAGTVAFEAGRGALALQELEAAIEADPGHIPARLKAAEVATSMNDLSRATVLLNQVLELDEENYDAMLRLGQALLLRNRAGEAREWFQKVLEVRPHNIAALRSLAQIAHEGEQDYEESLRLSQEILYIDDRNPHALLWGAEASAFVGRMDESVALYRRLFRQRPALVERMIHIAGRLVSMNRYDDASVLYQEAVSAMPNHNVLVRAWEEILTQLGGPERLRRGYEEMMEANPSNRDIKELHAAFLKREGDWEALVELREAMLDDDLSHIPSLLDMAEYHLDRGDFDQADPFFQAAISASPADAGVYRQVAESYLNHGEKEEARRLLGMALTFKPDDTEAMDLLSQLEEEAGNTEEAIRLLRDALKETPANAPLLSRLGGLYLRAGETENAKAIYQQVTAADPMNIEAWLIVAEIAMNEDDELALSLLEEDASRRLRNNPTFATEYGFLALEHGFFERARRSLERALRSSPENLPLRVALARACLHLDLSDLAIMTIEEAEDYTAQDPALLRRQREALAATLTDAGRHGEAEEVYRKLAAEAPEDVSLRGAIIFSLLHQGRDADAQEELNKTVQEMSADHYRETQTLRATYMMETGQHDRALGRLRALNSEYPGDGAIKLKLAIAAGETGDIALAESVYRELIDRGGADTNGWFEVASNNLGYLFAEEGKRLDEAEELVSQALAVNPNAAYILDSMGWVYFQKGELGKARKYLERANRLSLPDGEILMHLGQLYEQLGEVDDAKRYYDRAVEADPRLKQARELRDALAKAQGSAQQGNQ